MDAKDVSEQTLIAKKIPYYKSPGIMGDGYVIPQSKVRQLGDYTIRFLATPITVTIDAATVVVVVGGAILLMKANNAGKCDLNLGNHY